LKVNLT